MASAVGPLRKRFQVMAGQTSHSTGKPVAGRTEEGYSPIGFFHPDHNPDGNKKLVLPNRIRRICGARTAVGSKRSDFPDPLYSCTGTRKRDPPGRGSPAYDDREPAVC